MSSQMREASATRSNVTSKASVAETKTTRERSSSTSSTRDQFSKRSSIFSKRPRSTLTTASNDSSTRSVASNSSGSDLSRLSTGTDAPVLSIEPESTKARFLFGRGLKNRMSGIKALPTTNNSHRTLPVQGQAKLGKSFRISAPYNFQHVAQVEGTATSSVGSPEAIHHFRALSKEHQYGIVAPALAEYVDDGVDPMPINKQRKSPPLRPRRPDDPCVYEPTSSPLSRAVGPGLPITSAESGIYPMYATYKGMKSTYRVPVQSSTRLPQAFTDSSGASIAAITDLYPVDAFDEYEAFNDSQPLGWIEKSLPLLHTVLPVDTSSDHIRTPAFNLPLEQVLEEPEGTFSNRPSRDIARRPSLRQSKSTPMIAQRFRSSIDSFVDESPLPSAEPQLERPVSQCSEGSDTLGNPTGSSWHEANSRAKARSLDLNEPSTSAEPTWEDYIDNCYAEPECDFDWHETSHFDDNVSEASESWSEQYSPFSTALCPKVVDSRSMINTASHAHSMVSEKSDRIMSQSSVPELDYRFSCATSTASLSIGTPRDGSLYSGSDLPPLPADTHILKDTWGSTHFASADQLHNEFMVGRTAVVPDSPHYQEDGPPILLNAGIHLNEHHHQTLPIPSQEDRARIIHAGRFQMAKFMDVSSRHKDLSIASTSSPIEPVRSSDEGKATVAQTVDSGSTTMHESTSAWPLGDASSASNFTLDTGSNSASLTMRRQALPHAPPSLATSQTVRAPESTRSFSTTPSSRFTPKAQLSVEQKATNQAPLHISFPSIDLLPLTLPGTSIMRAQAESVAPRVGPLPLTTPEDIEKPGTPDSVSSAPGVLGRMGYTLSLFPSNKASFGSPTRKPLPLAPTSAPLPSPDQNSARPVSRAASQASSSNSSSRALSFKSKSSKTAKKTNTYQERFPLGI